MAFIADLIMVQAVGKLLKRNRAEVTAVLAVETSFLLQQLGPEGTENLLINLLITARYEYNQNIARYFF